MTLNISMQNAEKISTVEIYALDGKKIFYRELILWILIANWTYANFFI
jgi:hypothetical protein